jgi:hypothetical protein
MKPNPAFGGLRKILILLVSAIVTAICLASAYLLLAPAEWPLFRPRYEVLKFFGMRGYSIGNEAMDVRHPLFVEALAGDIANGSSSEAGWACFMSQAIFMRGNLNGDAIILERLTGPIVDLLHRETNSLVRCYALGVVNKSDQLAHLARKPVLESLESTHLWESLCAAHIVIFRLREDSRAKPLIDRLLDSKRDFEVREALKVVSLLPDLALYQDKIEELQSSSNRSITYEMFQIQRRVDMEAERSNKVKDGR